MNTKVEQVQFCPSAFTLTFVVEVVGLDIWHDCNEGWLDLGPPVHGVKLSYQLFPGQTFEVNVVIWPHVAKVFSGTNYGWVRTWQFLQRRWLTFSIRHVFPVRVKELRDFLVTVVPTAGLGALSAISKSDKDVEIYLPPLRFGDRRQFAEVIESECPVSKYIEDMVWFLVERYIPYSVMDGLFETPYPVEDIRHQDAALYHVEQVVLNHRAENKEDEEDKEEIRPQKGKSTTKDIKKEMKKTPEIDKTKYEITLPGDWILAGIGRVTPFVTTGPCPPDLGEVIALISSVYLPAQDDCPIFFVNVCNLSDVPMEHLKEKRFTHIYTRWSISEEERNSEQQPLQTKQPTTEVDFNDHHSVPVPSAIASDLMAKFLDEPFRVEVRGIRISPSVTKKMEFFGYAKADRDCGIDIPPSLPNQDVDILLAHTKIDARALTKINGYVKGEFPLYPPEPHVVPLDREEICTNDINAIRAKVIPEFVIQPGVILEAQMTLEVSLGLVGCKPKSLAQRYSRLYCLISDYNATLTLLRQIAEINESLNKQTEGGDLLTGFALDTGDTVLLYVEGPKEGQILRVWERTEDFYPIVKPIFSTSAKYSCRLYPELLLAAVPFNVMKMSVPLSILLSLTPIYVRPALPLPTRSAVLKIGRLVASKLKDAPCCQAMPTAIELKSFRLELCVAPRPAPGVVMPRTPPPDIRQITDKNQTATKINWKPKQHKCTLDPIFAKSSNI